MMWNNAYEAIVKETPRKELVDLLEIVIHTPATKNETLVENEHYTKLGKWMKKYTRKP